MKEYIKVFSSISDYNTFKSSANYYKPNISYINSAQTILYNPFSDQSQDDLQQLNPEERYLTFIALEDCTFSFSHDILYSINNGSTWINLSSNTNSPIVSTGTNILWKAELVPTLNGIGTFTSSGSFVVNGNVMSLLYGDDFVNKTSLYGKDFAFFNLFNGCTGITNVLNLILPATVLSNGCYKSMFYGCTNLVTSPKLEATTLQTGCYEDMFHGCVSLTLSPKLPALTLVLDCYKSMFYGCSNIDSIECLATDITATDCTTNWVNGVANNGTFVKSINNTSWITGNNGIPTNWIIDVDEDYSKQYFTIVLLHEGQVNVSSVNNSSFDYSVDGGNTWTTFNTTYTDLLPAGTKILWRGTTKPTSNSSGSGIGTFWSSSRCNVLGNILSLLYGDDFAQYNTFPENSYYTFYKLFENCSLLVRADNLILPTDCAGNCYHTMFSGCTNLLTAPKLPCTQRGDYHKMFKNCLALIKAPEMPATIYGSYGCTEMFYGCASLIEAPSELPAMIIGTGTYKSMFEGCVKLVKAPELPATVIHNYCYDRMFYGCVSLTEAPSELPAQYYEFDSNGYTEYYNCYHEMFCGCISLTKAPEIMLKDKSINVCCDSMFKNCTSLNYVKCTNNNTGLYSYQWLNNVSANGTFVKAAGATWEEGASGIPTGWTVVEE